MDSKEYFEALEKTYKSCQTIVHFYSTGVFDYPHISEFHDQFAECRNAINTSLFFVPEETMERLEEDEGQLSVEELKEAQRMIDIINLSTFAYYAYNKMETETNLNNFFVSVTASVQEYNEEEILLYINLKKRALQAALNAAGGPAVEEARKKQIVEDFFPANTTKYYLTAEKPYNSIVRSRLKGVRNELVKQTAFEIIEQHTDTSDKRIQEQLAEYFKSRFNTLNSAYSLKAKKPTISNEEPPVPKEEEFALPDKETISVEEELAVLDEQVIVPVVVPAESDDQADEEDSSTQGVKRASEVKEESRSSKKIKPSIFETQENARKIAPEEIFDDDPEHQSIQMEAIDSKPPAQPQNDAENEEEEEVDELTEEDDDAPYVPEVVDTSDIEEDDESTTTPTRDKSSSAALAHASNENDTPALRRPRNRPSRAAPAQAPAREISRLLPQPRPPKTGKRPRLRVVIGKWTEDEVAALEEGLLRIRAPAWTRIIESSGGRLSRRTGPHCKDKARTMIKAYIRAGMEDPEQWGAYKYVHDPVPIPGYDNET